MPGFFSLPTDAAPMPFGPLELDVPHYLLPCTYGRAEPEEAAARLVVLCQEAGEWVGVSLLRISEQMATEHTKLWNQQREISAAEEHNLLEQKRYSRRLPRYVLLCIFTLGLYAIFGKKLSEMQPNMMEVPTPCRTPFSLTLLFGPQPVIDGLAELAQRGMLRVERSDDGKFDVIFPTPALLGPIARFRRL